MGVSGCSPQLVNFAWVIQAFRLFWRQMITPFWKTLIYDSYSFYLLAYWDFPMKETLMQVIICRARQKLEGCPGKAWSCEAYCVAKLWVSDYTVKAWPAKSKHTLQDYTCHVPQKCSALKWNKRKESRNWPPSFSCRHIKFAKQASWLTGMKRKIRKG